MKKVLGIGNALVDIILFLENDSLLNFFNLPKGSMQLVDLEKSVQVEKATGNLKKYMSSGGSAANTIHGLARLGMETAFLGSVGSDEYGSFFNSDMIENNIKPLLISRPGETGRAISLVSPGGERTFATFLGAATELDANDLHKELFEEYDHLHLEGYLVLNQQLVSSSMDFAKRNRMTVSLDLASYNIVESHFGFLNSIIKEYHPIVFANEDEARAFTGSDDPGKALNIISEYSETVVVKTGDKGSLIAHKGNSYKVGIIDVNCIDTTGAGDLYAAGFLFGLLNDLHPQLCGEAGALLAGKVIEEPGAKIPATTWNYILQKIKTY